MTTGTPDNGNNAGNDEKKINKYAAIGFQWFDTDVNSEEKVAAEDNSGSPKPDEAAVEAGTELAQDIEEEVTTQQEFMRRTAAIR